MGVKQHIAALAALRQRPISCAMPLSRLVSPAACLAGLLALTPAAAGAETLLAHYVVRAAGLRVMDVEALLDLDGPRYRIRTRIRTTGLAGVFSRGDQVTSTEGAWRGTEPVPAH